MDPEFRKCPERLYVDVLIRGCCANYERREKVDLYDFILGKYPLEEQLKVYPLAVKGFCKAIIKIESIDIDNGSGSWGNLGVHKLKRVAAWATQPPLGGSSIDIIGILPLMVKGSGTYLRKYRKINTRFMAMDPGAFNLTTSKDLFKKAERELARMKAAPLNQDHAFNFFVTANHLMDWVYPDSEEPRKTLRKEHVEIKVCATIANGSKHFQTRHSGVKSAKVEQLGEGYFHSSYFAPSYFGRPYFGPMLEDPAIIIRLDGDAAELLGHTIKAIDLAEKIIEIWRIRLSDHS